MVLHHQSQLAVGEEGTCACTATSYKYTTSTSLHTPSLPPLSPLPSLPSLPPLPPSLPSLPLPPLTLKVAIAPCNTVIHDRQTSGRTEGHGHTQTYILIHTVMCTKMYCQKCL